MDHITRRITMGTRITIMADTAAAIRRDTGSRPDTTQTTTRRRRSMLRHPFTHRLRSMRLRRSIPQAIRATACPAFIWTGTVTRDTAATVGTVMGMGDIATGTVDMAITKRQFLQKAARTATGRNTAHRLRLQRSPITDLNDGDSRRRWWARLLLLEARHFTRDEN